MKRFRKRSVRAERRRVKNTGINLVSLMDIFTILVFFLLVNSSDVETLSAKDGIKLPESVSENKPGENIVISVNEKNILVQGKNIADVKTIMASSKLIIEGLKAELDYRNEKVSELGGDTSLPGAVTIMGDKKIPYKLLKRIMLTCANSNFGNISLAVQQRAKG